MKKLFFSALVALVAGSAAIASVGTPLANEAYYKHPTTQVCTLIPQCTTINTGAPCSIAPNNTYYSNSNCTSQTSAYLKQ